MDIIDQLQNKGVNVVSRKESLDTSTPQGKLMLTFFAGIATFEREIMLQRQREGIAIAKAAGKFKGSKPKAVPADWSETYQKYVSRQINLSAVANKYGVSRPTVYKWIKASAQSN